MMPGAREETLRCPTCAGRLRRGAASYACPRCACDFPDRDGLADFMPPGVDGMTVEEREHYTGNVGYYLEMHETWRGSPFYRHYHHRFLDDLRALAPGPEILELGCGLGHDGLALLESGCRVVETDVAPGPLGHAEEMHRRLGFGERSRHLLADACRLPFADGSFDGVLMVAMLHHLPDPRGALAEARRVLRPEGVLVLGTEPNNWQHAFLYPLGKRVLRVLHRLLGREGNPGDLVSAADKETEGFSRYEFEYALMRAGFETWELKPAGFVSAAAFFIGQQLSELLRRNVRLFPAERAGLAVDRAMERAGLPRRYPWHWNAVARVG